MIRRFIWLRSPERGYAIKRDKYTCQRCGRKQSKAKGKELSVQVHHKSGIDWQDVAEFVLERVLVHPDNLETVCKDCHKEEHKKTPR
jgi:5-methylcytosine-specific restriction endonuclease McrA